MPDATPDRTSTSRDSKINPQSGQDDALTKGDELLMRLLRTRMPVVSDPAPACKPKQPQQPTTPSDSVAPAQSAPRGPVEDLLAAHPGLTSEEVEEQMRSLGL